MNSEIFIEECNKIGIEINSEIIDKLNIYKDLLIEWNKKFNLTTIVDEKEIFLKHFYDSLCIVKGSSINNKIICDFGTGAGFPGMVLAIVFRNSKVYLIESNSKKILFLNEIKNKLELDNVNNINDRVENYARKNREKFDIVTCRAVSQLNIILELSVALLKKDGLFIPLKAMVDEEYNNSIQKTKLLGYDFVKKIEYNLPIENSKRTILIYKKTKKTEDKYPREYNKIKKECNNK